MKRQKAVGLRAEAPAPGAGQRDGPHERTHGRYRRRRRAAAFTLIELLVVVAIIGLLVGILVPSLGLAIELARRARCASNLGGIGRGLALYEASCQSYPFIALNGGTWNVAVGTSRADKPAGGLKDRNVTSCLYLLVREDLCDPGLFLCESSGERAPSPAGDVWDFLNGTAISYSVMNPYGQVKNFSSNVAGAVPLMADASPYFDGGTGLRNQSEIIDLNTTDMQVARKGNSPNHRLDGQNVAVFGGSARWQNRADAGVSNDNIYTRSASGPTDRLGTIPTGGDAAAREQGPAGPDDSYLLP